MKKLSIIFAAALGLFAAASCQKEQTFSDNAKGNCFEIIANIANKTTLDGYNVTWAAGDTIAVVIDDANATMWKTYKKFGYDSASGKFISASGIDTTGTVWFRALHGDNTQYSYHKTTGTTFKLPDTQTQDCSDPTANITKYDALAGVFEAELPITSAATLSMNHVFTLMEIDLINDSGAEITASSLSLTADSDIAGIYTIDYMAEPIAVSGITSGAKKSITVNLTGGAIADKGKLPVYLVMGPLANYSGDITLTVSDNVNKDVYTKTVTLTNANFNAGALNKTNYTLKEPTVIEYKTVAEVRAAEAEFTSSLNMKDLQVMATGASTYFVQDATGGLFVYGAPGTIALGDTVSYTGATTSSYKSVRQISAGSPAVSGNETPSYPSPTELDGAGLDALETALAANTRVGEYCKFKGALTVSGSYYNVVVSGASKKAALQKPNADLLPSAVSGSTIEVTGYSLYSTGTYVYFIATAIKAGCAAPQFSPAAGGVTAGTQVSLSCATEGATIYYTTDGSTPTTSSSVYSDPITVNEEVTIKAFAVAEGKFDSDVVSATYTIASTSSIICDFTTKKYGHSYYNDEWTYGESGATDVWKVKYGANNSKGWAYVKMGGKSSTLATCNPCEIYYTGKVTDEAKKVSVNIVSGSLSKAGMSVNSWGVYVYSDATMTTQIDYVAGGEITNAAKLFEFTPTSGKTWKDCYFKLSFDLANTASNNGIICLDKVTISF